MAALGPGSGSGPRMRLTVVVESLAEENAHGNYRDEALRTLKERKFAMPVLLEDTFETVWSDIEQRYKTNYLSPRQAAAFSIKKLQDAYDCDLDMTDTVGAIFEGEPDRKMHMIKVIPHFVYRETSVVPGSKLRPLGAQKRPGVDLHDSTNKRRRVESQQRQATPPEARDLSPNRPIPSTEPQHAVAVADDINSGTHERSTRSKSCVSCMSLIELSRTETGQVPFSSTQVKQESPGPRQSPGPSGFDAVSPDEPTQGLVDPASDKSILNEQPHQSHSDPPQEQPQKRQQQLDEQVSESEGQTMEHVRTSGGAAQAGAELAASPKLDSQEAAIHKSPVSSVDADPVPAPTTKKRRDIYQVPSSPDFMHKTATPDKPAKTYGRSPRSAKVIQKEVDLLNMARRLSRSSTGKGANQNGVSASITTKARVFQRPELDEIESTPQEQVGSVPREECSANSDDNGDDDADLTSSFLDEAAQDPPHGTQTPARKTPAKPVKPGSLRKPSRASLTAMPASIKRSAQFEAAGTPASATSTIKSGDKAKPMTPSTMGSPRAEKVVNTETTSRMERLQKILSASQNAPTRRADAKSSAWGGSLEIQDRSDRPSPEVRIPVVKKAELATSSTEAAHARLAPQPPIAQHTPLKSPVPLPSSARKSTPTSTRTSKGAAETPQTGGVEMFKKPTLRARDLTLPSPPLKRVSNATTTGIPRRSEIPLPANVRNLRRTSSLRCSPLANGDTEKEKSSPSTPAKTPAKLERVISSIDVDPTKVAVAKPAKPTLTAKPTIGAIVISSAEPSSTESSDSEDEQRDILEHDVDEIVQGADTLKDHPLNETDEPKHADDALTVPPQTQDRPTSGQGSSRIAPCDADSWGCRSLAPATPTSDQCLAEQETYSTAIEDNFSRSRSASAAASTRSSPAVSRRPARFLSHSPTPDASDSEDDSDEAAAAPSRAASPQADYKRDSESQSSSDSSEDEDEDEDAEMHNLPIETTTDPSANTAPPSSPQHAATDSTPVVPESGQSTPSRTGRPTQRTPAPFPAQQSSQAPRSSQSVSVQAADRRRYTGFRSLREQLADTKAAQATAQTRAFDPRTMSLGKLVKGKPLMSFGSDYDESSDDESSSSSSSSDGD